MRSRYIQLILCCVVVLSPRALRAQDEFASARFETSDGVTLHYLEAGSGPLLVFVPGWTMPAWIWENQIRHFSATHHVVALDPRGHGQSEKVSYGYYPSRRAQDIGELIDHLGGEPAVLAGWSLGMQEVMVYAHEFGTDHVRALVLVDHPVTFDPASLRGRFISMQTEREDWMRRFVRGMYATPQSEEYLEAVTRASLSVPVNATAIMLANAILMGPSDLTDAMNALDRPVLFVTSSANFALRAANDVRKRWPDVPVATIEGTRHALFADRPDEFNRVLEEFLATVER